MQTLQKNLSLSQLTKRTPIQYSEQIERFFQNKKKCKTITFQVTENCCLACTYCYQHHKTNNKMTFETAKKFINQLLANKFELINTDNTCGIILEFIGGEPFMEIELIDAICSYILNQLAELKHPWLLYTKFSLCSNGILYFDERVQNFLTKFNGFVELSISIDGNKELHDMCRKDLFGNGSYNRAIAAAIHSHEVYNNPLQTKMTLSPQNISLTSQAVIDLINKNFDGIYINCVFEEGWQIKDAAILYQELKIIADFLIDNNLYDKVFFRMFDANIGQPMDPEDNNNWCGGIADTNIAIDYKGNMFSCIRYMESSLNGAQPPLTIGDIENGYLSTDLYISNYNKQTNITRKSQSSEECFYCPVASGCAWCSGYNYEKFGDVNHRATFICDMHKATTLANVYFWNKLAKKLNLDERYKRNLSDIESLKIISENELVLLNNLEKE